MRGASASETKDKASPGNRWLPGARTALAKGLGGLLALKLRLLRCGLKRGLLGLVGFLGSGGGGDLLSNLVALVVAASPKQQHTRDTQEGR